MKTIQLSPAQLTLLESFANIESQAEADELSRVIRDYYARKLDEELDKLWDDGTLDQQKLDELREQHLRTKSIESANRMNLLDVDAQLDEFFGKEGTPERKAAEERAYAFYSKQINMEDKKNPETQTNP